MLFVITLTHRAASADVQAQLVAHRDWLVQHTASGRFLAAGPLESGHGGLILAQGDSAPALDAVLATDPFVALGLVDVEVQAFTPALRHEAFPAAWASGAKPVAAQSPQAHLQASASRQAGSP